MRIPTITSAALFGLVLATAPVAACPALKGATGWDSVFKTYGDPFFGGAWANSRGGSAFIHRTLNAPAKISGFYMRYAGSDVSADGARIWVRAKRTSDGVWVSLMDLRDIVIGRDFSGGVQPRRMGPVTITFPEMEVSALRIEMIGHGWFSLDQTMFFVRGCSSYNG